jgi:hypothetical protein
MYLGTIYVSSKFCPQSDLKYGHQVAILEKQLCANAWIIYLLGIFYGFFCRWYVTMIFYDLVYAPSCRSFGKTVF